MKDSLIFNKEPLDIFDEADQKYIIDWYNSERERLDEINKEKEERNKKGFNNAAMFGIIPFIVFYWLSHLSGAGYLGGILQLAATAFVFIGIYLLTSEIYKGFMVENKSIGLKLFYIFVVGLIWAIIYYKIYG